MDLYQRHQPVFVSSAGDADTAQRIVDILITWYATDLIYPPPAGAELLAPGETKLYNATRNSENKWELTFIGRHPQKDLYYQKTIIAGDAETTDHLAYTTDEYVYHVADESLIFYVSYFPGGILSVEGNGCYMLLNETNVNWGVGRAIEPFNVIFDTVEPTQTTLNGSADINSITLTNSPVLTDEDPPQGGTFVLDQNTIGMTRTDTAAPEVGGIISINGVTPQDGNINIKVLGGAGNG